MFKIGSFENEILRGMEKSLRANQTEESNGFSKLAKAADCLNNAATIFDQAGMHAEASEITEVLESLASKLTGKKYAQQERPGSREFLNSIHEGSTILFEGKPATVRDVVEKTMKDGYLLLQIGDDSPPTLKEIPFYVNWNKGNFKSYV